MRWLMIVFLVSIAALLLAAAGVARHIWLQRARLHSNPDAGPPVDKNANAVFDLVEDIDEEPEK